MLVFSKLRGSTNTEPPAVAGGCQLSTLEISFRKNCEAECSIRVLPQAVLYLSTHTDELDTLLVQSLTA